MMKFTFILFLNLSLSILAPAQLILKSIYDFDGRELISNQSSPEIIELSHSVGLIFYDHDLTTNSDSSVIFVNKMTAPTPNGSNICPNQKFADHQNYRPACTGFLVGKDLLATAGHCFKDKYDCAHKLITFNLTSDKEIDHGLQIENNNIYHCTKIISQAYHSTSDQLDYALIKLDHSPNRPALKIRTSSENIGLEEQVFMIGHPLGLPLVATKNGKVDENSDPIFFKTTLNSFHGNSGSPVFNAQTHLVEGIMVRGETDMEYDEIRKCNNYSIYSSSDHDKGEGVTRIKAILPFIYNRLD